MTKTTRGICKSRLMNAPMGYHLPVTAGHQIDLELVESVPRNDHQNALIVQEVSSCFIQSYPTKTKDAAETACFPCGESASIPKRRTSLHRQFKGVDQSVPGLAMDPHCECSSLFRNPFEYQRELFESATNPSPHKTTLGCTSSERCFLESSWVLSSVREEDGQVTC